MNEKKIKLLVAKYTKDELKTMCDALDAREARITLVHKKALGQIQAKRKAYRVALAVYLSDAPEAEENFWE